MCLFNTNNSAASVFDAAVSYENEIARRWMELAPGSRLPLITGGFVHLIFAGYSGSASGPDMCDAILSFRHSSNKFITDSQQPERVTGDVEFHIRASDWYTHGHDLDPAYNQVVLHVVMIYDLEKAILRQDGTALPTCSLQDLPLAGKPATYPLKIGTVQQWPCQQIVESISYEECQRLLERAGILRFEQKAHAFVELLHQGSMEKNLEHTYQYDSCLFPALAEGLAYGRDRTFFRAVALNLFAKKYGLEGVAIPEPSGRASQPSSLDATRLQALTRLLDFSYSSGIWSTVRALMIPELLVADPHDTLERLRQMFMSFEISLRRVDILLCNVIYPFAAAVALLEGQRELEEKALALYRMHPGLTSNRITRLMSKQLLLTEEPTGSCAQQGLHYIYSQTCRKKYCEICLMGKKDI